MTRYERNDGGAQVASVKSSRFLWSSSAVCEAKGQCIPESSLIQCIPQASLLEVALSLLHSSF